MQVPENLTANFPNPSMSSLWSEQLIKMLINPQNVHQNGVVTPAIQDYASSGTQLREAKTHIENHPPFHLIQPTSIQPNCKAHSLNQSQTSPEINETAKAESASQFSSATGQFCEDKLAVKPMNSNHVNELTFLNQNHYPLQTDSSTLHNQQIDAPQLESANLSGSFPPPYQSLSEFHRPPMLSSVGNDLWDHQMNNSKYFFQANQPSSLPMQDPCSFRYESTPYGSKDLPDESHNQTEMYSCLNFDSGTGGSTVIDPSVSSTILDEFCTLKENEFQNPCDYLVGNFCSGQDVQSQITTASLADSQAFSIQELPDNSGGASSSNGEFNDSSLLHNSSWQQVAPRVRTYTKVKIAWYYIIPTDPLVLDTPNSFMDVPLQHFNLASNLYIPFYIELIMWIIISIPITIGILISNFNA